MRHSRHYDREKRFDRRGARWHFVNHVIEDDAVAFEGRPVEWHFRDGARTAFGVLRFERRKDYPFRSYAVVIKQDHERRGV